MSNLMLENPLPWIGIGRLHLPMIMSQEEFPQVWSRAVGGYPSFRPPPPPVGQTPVKTLIVLGDGGPSRQAPWQDRCGPTIAKYDHYFASYYLKNG